MTIATTIRRTVSLAALTAVTASAAIGVGVPAATAASAGEVREVCAKSVYVKKAPGVIPIGSVFQGDVVKVIRYSASGRFAQIRASQRAHRPLRGWVPTRYLCAQTT